MKSAFILAREKEAEEWIAAGRLEEAANTCDAIAGYYSLEEANCDQAGEFAEGMRASRSAEEWSARARELRRGNKA